MKLKSKIPALLVLLMLLPSGVRAAELIPGGQVVGLELLDGTVTVASLETPESAAGEAGILPGDQILRIDGKKIQSSDDLKEAMNHSRGIVSVTVRRSGSMKEFRVVPRITSDGPKLGLYLRSGITGIGTVTWYDPETGRFGALGHGVNGAGGNLLDMEAGQICGAKVIRVQKGIPGKPGQLMGTTDPGMPIGKLEKNTPRGVFGKIRTSCSGSPLQTAQNGEIHTGNAVIRSTVSGAGVQEYSVEILKIYPKSTASGRNMLLKITDPALLAATGGIVQGMSGSPILQDGRLVGAVTHVLVNDPTRGYGIFIENMLEAAG